VLSAGFRRLLSVPLVLSVLATLGLVTLTAAANSRDSLHALHYEQQVLRALAAHQTILAVPGPDASAGTSAWTLLIALALAGGAAFLAFNAYQPRLREYT
jgi:UDP-N-acetylmuramyl pentapeptide phosphotransferase/UDP-N-acetylglucosamine-1-phosphate transferase